jgi:hypothetical protein
MWNHWLKNRLLLKGPYAKNFIKGKLDSFNENRRIV